jgi:hypothetical protein
MSSPAAVRSRAPVLVSKAQAIAQIENIIAVIAIQLVLAAKSGACVKSTTDLALWIARRQRSIKDIKDSRFGHWFVQLTHHVSNR